jgi:hypothetical protein
MLNAKVDQMSGPSEGLASFVALLDRCKAQVEADPDGYLENQHLYGALQHIYLRLCHGNIPESERLRNAKV